MPDLFVIKRLDKLFGGNYRKKSSTVTGKCHICRRKSEIEIVRTSGGYGLNGGTLQSQKNGRVMLVCADCFNLTTKRKPLTGVEKTGRVIEG